jgi:RIO kinase 1
VHSPKPYAFRGNVLVMEFIGTDGSPSNTLREVTVKEPEKVLDAIIEEMKKLYQSELVHADMSEYNILMLGEVPYLIDFGQAVHIKHPNSMAFLERDVANLLHHFSVKYGIERDKDATLKYIIG